ncbi:MAG TPA: hypothetical protein VGE93_03120 [Bryobacteraceae bacterium]
MAELSRMGQAYAIDKLLEHNEKYWSFQGQAGSNWSRGIAFYPASCGDPAPTTKD